MDERENPMVRDDCWPEYNSNYYDDKNYLDYWDHEIDASLGK